MRYVLRDMESDPVHDVVVVGAGPSGLAAAIHAGQRGLDAVVLERGRVGEAIAAFPKQMVFFTHPEGQEIAGLPCDCTRSHPTREEYLSYLLRVVRLTALDVREQTELRALEHGDDYLVVRVHRKGRDATLRTRNLVLATGGKPRRLQVPGADHPRVVYAYGDPYAYRRQQVVIVGAGNGAAEAALRLCREADAEVTVLDPAPALQGRRWRWQFPDVAELVEDGQICLLHDTTVERITGSEVVISSPIGQRQIPHDHVIVQIGYRPDTALFDAVGIAYDHDGTPALQPRTLESSVPGVYVAGFAVTGEPDFILISGGRNHGKVIAANILGEEPLIDDLGVERAEHWLQFHTLASELDPRLASELVPVVIGDFPHQLLDVYQPALSRQQQEHFDRGVSFRDVWQHSLRFDPVIDELAVADQIEVRPDGSVKFKGRRFAGNALDILRLADGRRRIRDIIDELARTSAGKPLAADTITRFLVNLMRVGSLTWRATPRPPGVHASRVAEDAHPGSPS